MTIYEARTIIQNPMKYSVEQVEDAVYFLMIAKDAP